MQCIKEGMGAKLGLGVADSVSIAEWLAHCDMEKYLVPCIEPILISTLAQLQKRGIKFGIVTNGPRAYCLRVLSTLKLQQFFSPQHIICIEDTLPFAKPHVKVLELVRFLEIISRHI